MNHAIKARLLHALRSVRNLHWKWTLLCAGIVATLGWVALLPPWQDEPTAISAAPAPASAPGSNPTPPTAAATPAQPPAAVQAPRTDLLKGLASENSGDRIEALRSIANAGAVELLPGLLEFDLPADPEVAPTLISVVTQLSSHAGASQRSAVAQRLTTWLQHELTRDARDARGNTASLVEALGKIDSPEASDALSAALDAQRLPLHVETVAVQGLAHSADAERARPAVERFRQRLQQSPAADSFERELQQEAITAADQALARTRG